MLIEFSVENFRSFKDLAVLSMVAAPKLKSRDPELDDDSILRVPDGPALLRTAAIYGANASGKSNLIRAFDFMVTFILTSLNETRGTGIAVESFRLNPETQREPSTFEMVFLAEGKPYRYGFKLTHEQVLSEWLFWTPTTREARLFEREGDAFTVSREFRDVRHFTTATRPNALFLSVAAQFNGQVAQRIVRWLSGMRVQTDQIDTDDWNETLKLMLYQDGTARVSALIRAFDLGIDEVVIKPVRKITVGSYLDAATRGKLSLEGDSSLEAPLSEVRFVHARYNSEGERIGQEDFGVSDESAGTRKLFALAGALFGVLERGGVLVIDELDARLHPMMTRAIVRLFNSRETNPHGGQLILTTQDTNLLDYKLLRRDQIWFAEKDRQGVSHLYSLAEFREPVRNDANYERNYIKGRYGAVPFLGDLASLWSDGHAES